ncbi:putative disease resistance protein RGA3 [Mangifera indica]|uniref:putative disease resistance protein RGA3 n=1 Tax=Mangifera indica TaxID=29780 RepID=UPI001CFC3800|nr:putative disease resistance protein RGA3 [Mangifera indica]XP_044496191.1 putative disease resistance protein RGA3 [Mangifera indica]
MMAEAFVQILLDNLNSLIGNEVGLLWGVDKEMKKLSSLFSTIQAVLEDAGERQVEDKAIKNWLRKLKEAAYVVDDILDDCATEASRLEHKCQNSRFINKTMSSFMHKLRPHNILFCHKIGVRMREITDRLDEIAQERSKFHLNEFVSNRGNEVTERRQTASVITQSQVYGRDEDKEKIIECLVKRVACCDCISIYPIVGLGGLGKTTLAQVVFNDERVKSHFEVRIWVCVSEDFNVRRIVKAIIESASGTTCEFLDLDPLQRRLQDLLNEKRYLLVLDDVWNEDQDMWDRLKFVLACGSKGASIIVTTRINRVASIMGTFPQHNLSGLLEDDCWSLFKERAFGPDREERPNLVELGKEIVKKCGGVPLAVKSLGGLMRFKDQENEWLSVRDSELWNLPLGENSILPALRLSYSHLPSKVRQCFAYCALFPKDFWIEKKMLLHLWMANGFIPSSGKQELEDIGNEICNELCWRSFLLDSEEYNLGNVIRFSMHDLVHDLAQSIMEDECHAVEYQCTNFISKGMVHVSINTDLLQSFVKSNALHGLETLRTIYLVPGYTFNFSCDFSRFISLRALSVFQHNGKKLSSISHLKHLRYLNLSNSNFVKLPESICRLVNMQTLILEQCGSLLKLPKRMQCLKNLRHLYLNHCYKLSQMPPRIGQITCLQTLTLFIVGKRKGYHLAELKDLNLGGELHIKYLQRVCNPLDAKEANLLGKQNLRRLTLSWEQVGESELLENAEEVLEALEPPRNLEHLVIEGYKGAHFPLWLNDQNLSKVVSIELMGCSNCVQLPSLGKLPFLRYLIINTMTQVLYIDHDIQSGGLIGRFPSLKKLVISKMPRLLRLTIEDGKELFPCLTNLEIYNCHKLTLPCLPLLKDLRVRGCSDALLRSVPSLQCLLVGGCSDALLRSISNARRLNYLHICDNDESIYLPQEMLQNLTSLHSFTIGSFSKLKGLPTELQQLSDLRALNIFNCPELVAFPEGIKHLSSLQHLTISGGVSYMGLQYDLNNPTGYKCACLLDTPSEAKLAVLPEVLRYIPALQSLCVASYRDLASLPNWLGDLTSLQSLYIYNCPNLSSLPDGIQSLSNLLELEIYCCPELVKRCEKETGEDWYKIANIPKISVKL